MSENRIKYINEYNKQPFLTVVIPCFNESKNICQAIDKVNNLIGDFDAEILVIDDKSDDETYEIAKKHTKIKKYNNVRIISRNLERRGYGAVIKFALALSNSKYMLLYSADMVDPIHLLPKMVEYTENFDLIQVSRYLNQSDSESIPFIYKFYQFFYRIFVKVAIGKKINDSTYAFKLFDRSKILALGISSQKFSISPEILFKSILSGYKVKFIRGSQTIRKQGQSKFNFWNEGPGFIYCLIRSFLHRKRIAFWF